MVHDESAGSTLGLERGTVRPMAAEGAWVELGQQEVAMLLETLDGLGCAVEHVGSTAVPGLTAKPILDVAGGTARDDTDFIDTVATRLASVGLIDRGRRADGGRLFVRGGDDRRVAYVHVLLRSDPKWSHYVQFRDFLRSHPERCDHYARLKERLAADFPHDRGAYTDGKANFIAETLRLAAAGR